MDPWIWHQVCLELIEVNIQGSFKPKRGCDGGDNLGNQPIEVGIGGSCYFKISPKEKFCIFINFLFALLSGCEYDALHYTSYLLIGM